MKRRFLVLLALALLPGFIQVLRAAPRESILNRKLREIIIDKIEFDEVSLPTVIKHIKQRAKELDPDGKGINVMFMPPRGGNDEMPMVTMLVEDIPLGELIRYVCKAVDYHYKVDRHAVIIAHKSRAIGELETKMFRVRPETIQSLKGSNDKPK